MLKKNKGYEPLDIDHIEHYIPISWSPIFNEKLTNLFCKACNELLSIYQFRDSLTNMNYTKDNDRSRRRLYMLPAFQKILNPFQRIQLEEVRVIVVFNRPGISTSTSGIPGCNEQGEGVIIPTLSSHLEMLRSSIDVIPKDGTIGNSYCNQWFSQGVLPIYAIPTTEAIRTTKENKYDIDHGSVDFLDYHKGIWTNFFKQLMINICNHNRDIIIISFSSLANDILPNIDYKHAFYSNTMNGHYDSDHGIQDDDNILLSLHRSCPFYKTSEIIKNTTYRYHIIW
jgi:uracil DNA glycosylase